MKTNRKRTNDRIVAVHNQGRPYDPAVVRVIFLTNRASFIYMDFNIIFILEVERSEAVAWIEGGTPPCTPSSR